MKTSAFRRGPYCCRVVFRRGERGFLIIALLALVAIMLIYVAANVRVLGNLKRELKQVEQKQIQRLEKLGAQPLQLTNAITAVSGTDAPPGSR